MKALLLHRYAVLAILSFFTQSIQSSPAPQTAGTPDNPSGNGNDNAGDIPAPFILHIDPAVAVDTTRGTVASTRPLADDPLAESTPRGNGAKTSEIEIPFVATPIGRATLLDGRAKAVVWFEEPVDVTEMYVTGGPTVMLKGLIPPPPPPPPASYSPLEKPWTAAYCITLKKRDNETSWRVRLRRFWAFEPGDPPRSERGVAGVACYARRFAAPASTFSDEY